MVITTSKDIECQGIQRVEELGIQRVDDVAELQNRFLFPHRDPKSWMRISDSKDLYMDIISRLAKLKKEHSEYDSAIRGLTTVAIFLTIVVVLTLLFIFLFGCICNSFYQ